MVSVLTTDLTGYLLPLVAFMPFSLPTCFREDSIRTTRYRHSVHGNRPHSHSRGRSFYLIRGSDIGELVDLLLRKPLQVVQFPEGHTLFHQRIDVDTFLIGHHFHRRGIRAKQRSEEHTSELQSLTNL